MRNQQTITTVASVVYYVAPVGWAVELVSIIFMAIITPPGTEESNDFSKKFAGGRR